MVSVSVRAAWFYLWALAARFGIWSPDYLPLAMGVVQAPRRDGKCRHVGRQSGFPSHCWNCLTQLDMLPCSLIGGIRVSRGTVRGAAAT